LRERLEGAVEPDDIVLLFTGCSEHWGDDTFLREYTYLTGDGANFLVSKRVRAVGQMRSA
jgi:kynurenine formamidase